jgi:hypothetical protein
MDQSKKIIPIQTTQAPTFAEANAATDVHVQVTELFLQATQQEAISSVAPARKQKNLTEVVATKSSATRANRVALVIAPEWAINSPPYGVARMAALSSHMGFETKTWDINIHCYYNGPQEYWSAYADWKWHDPHYSENIHPKIVHLLDEKIQEIVKFAPTIIGFSIWYTNNQCAQYISSQLRKFLPTAVIVYGGASATQGILKGGNEVDHVIAGEGELLWVQLLEHYENPQGNLPHTMTQSRDQRVDLDSMPPADYSDFDISLYESNGITSEFSRGCIATCAYCNETQFWKFRARQAHRVLDEIELAYRSQQIRSVYFIDSLLNGNLKEFESFARGLIERDIKITWTGYARIDGRIDKDLWQLLQQAGALGFAFGVESGSQHTLDLMRKKCKAEWIEQNFEDMASVGMYNNFATWFTGFPGEEIKHVAESLTMLWRLRNSGMGNLSMGTAGLGVNTPLDNERDKFGVSESDWSLGWHTVDMRNTVFHRFLRFKFSNIFLEHFRNHRTNRNYFEYTSNITYPGLQNQYSLEYNPAMWEPNKIPWEPDFDYEIIKVDINPVANTLVNEIWALLRVMWLAMGPFSINIRFDPEEDKKEFGYHRYPMDGTDQAFYATYVFNIDANGTWQADFNYKLEAEDWINQLMSFEFNWQGTGHWDRPKEI